jgi:hypothetical protein
VTIIKSGSSFWPQGSSLGADGADPGDDPRDENDDPQNGIVMTKSLKDKASDDGDGRDDVLPYPLEKAPEEVSDGGDAEYWETA